MLETAKPEKHAWFLSAGIRLNSTPRHFSTFGDEKDLIEGEGPFKYSQLEYEWFRKHCMDKPLQEFLKKVVEHQTGSQSFLRGILDQSEANWHYDKCEKWVEKKDSSKGKRQTPERELLVI